MQKARSGRSPRQDERAQRIEVAVELVDLPFQSLDLRVGHLQSPARIFGLVGKAEGGPEIEQTVLKARENGIKRFKPLPCVEAREPDGRVGLVESAVNLYPEIVFRDAPACAQRSGAIIAG